MPRINQGQELKTGNQFTALDEEGKREGEPTESSKLKIPAMKDVETPKNNINNTQSTEETEHQGYQ